MVNLNGQFKDFITTSGDVSETSTVSDEPIFETMF